jgi:hypothetical protein
MDIAHETCGRCGRKLKTPKSMADGFGPVCKRKVEADKTLSEQQEAKLDDQTDAKN